ncbi:hypothetical protein HPB50_021179 [Hyalomma asiaticum]|uniref:Uncharacterized protein n=1 Tax=Hyalomma asiaticum TaxID=266040 RepID=A0ACB7S1J9_HYAAI|nr:hypothetical protein HPB50_021179 [Hyalomma asiaticum]
MGMRQAYSGLHGKTLHTTVVLAITPTEIGDLRAVAAIRAKLVCPWLQRPRIHDGRGTAPQASTTKAETAVTLEQPAATVSTTAACSVMVARLLWHNRLSRFFGCLFVSNLNGKTLKNAVATWKSPYTIYAALWFSIFLGYQVIALTSASRSVDVHKTFPRYLRFVSYAVSVTKVCVSYVSFCLGSEGLLEFMKSATVFEMSTSFSLPVKRRLDLGRRVFNVIVKAMLVASFIGAFIIAVTDGMRKIPAVSMPWRVVIGVVVFCSEVAFFMYDSLLHVITTRCSGVLIQYLESELARLEANCLDQATATHYAQLNAVSKIAMVRVNVCRVKALKGNLDNICGTAIVASSSCLLALLCLNVYRSFTLDVRELELWLPIVYTMYCGLCLVDMAFVSDDLSKQIRYLHSTIEPDEMCFTGAGFFRLDRGLLLTEGALLSSPSALNDVSQELSKAMPCARSFLVRPMHPYITADTAADTEIVIVKSSPPPPLRHENLANSSRETRGRLNPSAQSLGPSLLYLYAEQELGIWMRTCEDAVRCAKQPPAGCGERSKTSWRQRDYEADAFYYDIKEKACKPFKFCGPPVPVDSNFFTTWTMCVMECE